MDSFRKEFASVDMTPWAHPFLTANNISRCRAYSERVWSLAASRQNEFSRQLSCAFAVNMAQNMYNWAKLVSEQGAQVTLYLNPQDRTAISRPEWEEFDGEYKDLLDGGTFLSKYPDIQVPLAFENPPNDGNELWAAYHPRDRLGVLGRLKAGFAKKVGLISPHLQRLILSDLGAVASLYRRSPSVRHTPLLKLQGAYPYFRWAEMLAQHDVTYIASTPFPAYVSGKPYCVASVGGDMQFDCGRSDDLGVAMRVAFSNAKFILMSNPHTLAHCRRLGLKNALYLPYPIDTKRYSPSDGQARNEWIGRFGGEVFVLTTARVDSEVKGHGEKFFEVISQVARNRSEVRFIFLGWGSNVEQLRARIHAAGLQHQLIILPPVGKVRLIDYYRSCDIVLDQFVFGYFGATALEAASVGKPIIMRMREDHYSPLYRGDVAPVMHAATPEHIRQHLYNLIDSSEHRLEVGRSSRDWLVRNHGAQKTGPLLLALLQLAADRVKIPRGFDNPLEDPLSDEERQYHVSCLQDRDHGN